VAGDRITVRGTAMADVSRVAFDHRIHVVEITEHSTSLEEILLEMTGATAQFAAA
jgi:ABC-2 type transport system ATP-binding protein